MTLVQRVVRVDPNALVRRYRKQAQRVGVNAFHLLALALLAIITPARAGETIPASPAAILQELRSFKEMGTVLYVAAHPDDENTQLITYLSRGRGYRTAYLSLTRGDGGQNEIGSEFGEKLGVARTQELLAARRLDGGRQFFTRALDYGFSKDYREALGMWDRQQVLADVVRVIRAYRPDVMITRFSPEPSTTHGHHTASAVLAIEAFKLAGDPTAFPEQLAQGLTPWQPKRILQNGGIGGRGAAPADAGLRVEVGGTDPVTGEPFGAIAVRSRAMHKTQAFGGFSAAGSSGPRQESFTLLGGEPATSDILDGVDTTWARVPGGAEIGPLVDAAIAQFTAGDPAANGPNPRAAEAKLVPALLEIRAKLAALPSDPVVNDKRAQLDRILQACLGLSVQTTLRQTEVVPGETMNVGISLRVENTFPVKWVGQRDWENPGVARSRPPTPVTSAINLEFLTKAPATLPVTQPYWLQEEGTAGMFRVDDPKLIGRPENPPRFPIEYLFEVGGQTLVISDELVHATGTADGERRDRVDVIAPVSLRFVPEVQLFAPNGTRPVIVEISAARADTAGQLALDLPAGWKAAPATQPFRLAKDGDTARFTFDVTAPAQPGTASIGVQAEVNGAHWKTQRFVIDYAHIPRQLLQSTERLRAVDLDLAIRAQRIGYLPGSGDAVPECLAQMGCTVTTLTGADLTPEKLHGLDAVVIGVRAFNVRPDLADHLPGLLAYVESGGTVIAQYNWPRGLKTPRLGPYPLAIGADLPRFRVTDEHSPVTFLAPDHPALTTPNRIGPDDFTDWVQERGAYFPATWDEEHYTAVLAMNDPGEAPLQGSLLVARHGKGYFVYTGLAFFRQLPAGVPGAYRLFANLLSLGK